MTDALTTEENAGARAIPARKRNLGPSAGPANRQALIEAARIEFATGGGNVPLSRIAQRANVGQGSLYRHFPDRLALATGVFETNLAEVEQRATQAERPFSTLLDAIEQQAAEASALIEIVSASGTGIPVKARDSRSGGADESALLTQLHAVLARVRAAAVEAGEITSHTTVEDLLVAVSMLAFPIAKTPKEQQAETGRRARRILEAWLLAEDRDLNVAPGEAPNR
ncbi:helix-turn-helix transcriptional regulator [Kocuria sp. cx-116]|uniref:TetR/AcrR family transcriptional regulator n=1 Tax=Kocuria sp. cx-116 TaxID=2771378 RepID=UPI001687D66A|nr:TetR family transcriptional regulator [Kocuria sp. cx-116]MBD2762471.1 helix-turn-helix transcriptional regulator [Kocuria sp. cx-116]